MLRVAAIGAALASCANHGDLQASYEPAASDDKIPLDIALVEGESFRTLQDKYGDDTLTLQPALGNAVAAELNSVFKQVTRISSLGAAKGVNLAIEPVVEIAHAAGSRDESIRITMRAVDPASGSRVAEYQETTNVKFHMDEGTNAAAILTGMTLVGLPLEVSMVKSNVLKAWSKMIDDGVSHDLSQIADKMRDDEPMLLAVIHNTPKAADVDDVIARGTAAEQQGLAAKALTIYTDALQRYETRLDAVPDIVDRAIDVALRMRNVPIPNAARKQVSAADEAIRRATTRADLMIARRDYENALAQAPWWADAWFNLSKLDGQVGTPTDVRRDLTWYVRAAPDAPDREAVQKQIDGTQ